MPTLRRLTSPGVSAGTRNIDIFWYGGLSGSVIAIVMKKLA